MTHILAFNNSIATRGFHASSTYVKLLIRGKNTDILLLNENTDYCRKILWIETLLRFSGCRSRTFQFHRVHFHLNHLRGNA